MSEELDRRIRELFSEADRAAPEASSPPDLSRERSRFFIWTRRLLIPVASLILLLAGAALVFGALDRRRLGVRRSFPK